MDAKTIGRKVRELRSRMGLTTISLARKLRISQAQVSRLENGLQGFRHGTLVRIAKALGVPTIYFFVEDETTATSRVAEQLDKRGLEATGGLRKALANAAFLRFMEKCAAAFARDRKRLAKMEQAVRRVI